MAGMTKQHFNKIAEIIREDLIYKDTSNETDGHKNIRLIESLCKFFKEQNPLFDENRFKKACLK